MSLRVRNESCVLIAVAGLLLGACSGDSEPGSGMQNVPSSSAGSAAISGMSTAGAAPIGSGTPSPAQGMATPPASGAAGSGAAMPGGQSGMAPAPASPMPPAPRPPGMGTPRPAPGGMTMPPAAPLPAGMPPAAPMGVEDGDPSMPIVATPDVPCGGPTGRFGLGSANFKMDERDMIVTYPCNKHAGAPATFILNLHGTTPLEQHFYQHGYFSAHTFTASHNLIIVTPSSVVQQWGNGDDGKDEPHLMKIIDWVYANLNGPSKFNIKSMWVGGHSWGGGYTARFGCKPELADKVKGLILMSGGGVSGFGGAACASKVSAIITTAEGDNRMPGDQMMLATSHGCDAGQSQMILNNVHSFWPNCDPGFVHANYYMLGKQHATSMDKDVVKSIVDWIKMQRQ